MQIFHFPYVIITILAILFFIMALIGVYFTVKSVKASKGTAKKTFCGIGKMKALFEKSTSVRTHRSLLYISIASDGLARLYPESKVNRIYEQIRKILFKHFCIDADGEMSLYGPESYVSLVQATPDDIKKTIQACNDELSAFFAKHGCINVTGAHFGYFCTRATEVFFKTALERAKQACSIAENNQALSYMWDPSSGKEFERKIKIENNIENEIDNNRFFLEYQPLVDAKNGTIIGAEVLSRLNSSTEGILSPRSFLSAVNNVGLNDKFDYYILEKTCKWISNDPKKRAQYIYTVNFSRQTLCNSDLPDQINNIIHEHGIDSSCIAIEILEDQNLNAGESGIMIENLKRLREIGFMILLDDFGKGYTSFGDLTKFSVNIIKIDKTITHEAMTETGFIILKNIINTAHDLGLKTLCEGIETEEHRQRVVEANCDMMQGYYFYRPMPVTDFEKLSQD